MLYHISSNRWWKKVLTRQLICLCLLFCITQVARTQTVKIIKAEYFWDTDPGRGLGTTIPFTASDTINISPNLTIPALGAGYHVLYIRTLKDSLGFQTWGLTDSKTLYIGNTQNVQFFWDTDPGTSAATIITTNLNDSINISPNVAAPLNGGWHTLYTRRVFQNADGTVVPTSLAEASKIVLVAAPERIEYFWDNDPGIGNGIQLSGPGNTIDSINVNYTIPTTGLATGFHKLYIRRAGGATFESLTDVRDVKILGLTGGEYFVDTDPGVGLGIPFTLGIPTALPTETGDTINSNWNWVAGCYSPGPHNMYIRMKDGGVWSLTDSIAFTMLPDNPILTVKNPGPGPNGTPVKTLGSNALAPYTYRLVPGSFQTDTIFLVPNGTSVHFQLRDSCATLKDTTFTTPAAPTGYVSSNARGGTDLQGFRHMVYIRDSTNLANAMVAVQDNNLWLGHVGVNTYFSSGAVATSFNTNKYLKRSFRITTALNPVGSKKVRLYISAAELTALQAADPTSFPNGNSSITVTKYTGPQEDSLFNPLPGGNSIIIPNSAITIATPAAGYYSLEFDVTGFSGFYIGGNNTNINLCPGTNITIPSDVTGSAYQWQVDNGSGFTNISDGVNYSGTNTSALTLINVPTTFNKYRYRAVVTTGGGPVNSQVYTVKFTVSWLGGVSSAWENTANWSCGAIPDVNTDVYISAGKPNNPTLNSIRSVHSLILNPGAIVTIAAGFRLNILGP